MSEIRTSFIKLFTSLKLTVLLLAFSLVLVFVATLDQVNLGIWAVQAKYFRSFFVMWPVPGTEIAIPIFPGGYLVGGFLLVNLVAAHVYRFHFSWKKVGILLTHFGLILLLVGELLSGLWQQDFKMELNVGDTKNYSESFRDNELAIIDTTDADYDQVTAIPESLLAQGGSIQHASLPFRIVVKEYYGNSALAMRDSAPNAPASPATAGIGPRLVAQPMPMTYRPDTQNMPTVFVELVGPEGSLGTYIASTQLALAQPFTVGKRSYSLTMRTAREYKPFTLKLLELHHDVYAGSDIPRNFSSRVHLSTPDGKEDRDVVIFMNNPLRYGGYTFYQYQMNQASNNSVFQVVRNPSWLIPYISCLLLTIGMSIHFGISLLGFLAKHRKAPARKSR